MQRQLASVSEVEGERTVICQFCPVCTSGCDVGVLWQTVGWIKMPLGTKVGLGLGHIVLNGDQLPKRSTAPSQFSAHVCRGQTHGWIKMSRHSEGEKGMRQTHLFYFFDLQPHFQITGVQVAQSPDCGAKFAVFRSSKYTGVGGGYSNPLSLGISQLFFS